MKITLLVLTGCTMLAPTLFAQSQGRRSPQETVAARQGVPTNARQFRRLRIPGEEVEKNVGRLTEELHWFKTLGGALGSGRAKGRPILWVQALGELDGFL